MTFTEFKRFADENNIIPVSTEIYSKMITDSVMLAKYKGVLQEIRQEINKYGSIMVEYSPDKAVDAVVEDVLKQAKRSVLAIIDKHIKEIES